MSEDVVQIDPARLVRTGEAEERVFGDAEEKAMEEFGRMFPMGVGMEFRSIPPTEDKVVKAPHGAMALVVMAMMDGVPCRHVVDCKLTSGQHPAMVLARLCEQAAKQLKVVAKKTRVQR